MTRIAIIALFLTTFSLADQSSSYTTTQEFYDWYTNSGTKYRDDFRVAKPYFTDELYGMLAAGFKNGPKDKFKIGFDPFINTQIPATKVFVGQPYRVGPGRDLVMVTPVFRRDGTEPLEGSPMKVFVEQVRGQWQIANIVYTGKAGFDLKEYLEKGLGIAGPEAPTGGAEEPPDPVVTSPEPEPEEPEPDPSS
jgi:hypothetical protein